MFDAMTTAAVSLKDVHLTLPSRAGNVDILRGVDLTVRPGEALGIVGPSGSGKTTLLMVIAGLERASRGDVMVAGQSLAGKGEDELAAFRRDNIGIVFQSFHLIPTMTALENVAVPLEFRGARDAMGIAEEKLKRVGLGHRLTHYPGQLSGGEQQRVAIARALASGARIIIADEPTGNLDHVTGEQIIKLLFDVRTQDGASLLLVTHDRSLAERCDRMAEVLDGKIVSGAHPGVHPEVHT
jgi:putative ABC transport system ATP-binding protein